MPQASEEQRAKWGENGGCGEGKAIAYLTARGYTLLSSWFWRKPAPDHEITQEEGEAIWFLIDEWDFGGVEPALTRSNKDDRHE